MAQVLIVKTNDAWRALRENVTEKSQKKGYLSNGVLLTFAQHFGVHQEMSWSLMIPFKKLWMMLPEARTLFCLRFQSEICWSLFEQLDQLLFVREPLQQMVDVMGLGIVFLGSHHFLPLFKEEN